jgi:hypothetical protein
MMDNAVRIAGTERVGKSAQVSFEQKNQDHIASHSGCVDRPFCLMAMDASWSMAGQTRQPTPQSRLRRGQSRRGDPRTV